MNIEGVGRCAILKSFHFACIILRGHNQLTEFPNVFHIPYLKELNLHSNRISSIPDKIVELKHLTHLDLGDNLIENVESLQILASLPVFSSYLHIFIYSLTHSYLHSFIHSLIHIFIHSFTHSLISSFTHSLTHS